MSKLSRRQQEILDYIKEEVRAKGYPPSVREIGEAVGLASSSTVHGHLSRLEKKGYIRRDPTKPRAIEVLDLENLASETTEAKATYIPVVGKVTAGLPITAVENVEEYFPLPEQLTANDNTYALRIQGDSMIEAGIFDGDLVIVRQQQTADNGDIIVAMTEEDEATVKRFFREKDYIRLQPENSTMEPIILTTCTILGKVIGVFRTIH
ncbi:transcriptional repressor LexA [Halalkalibacterium halodurans]|uniref:LexA repressor n=1 Tax=Halalkalibacterium halodurans (strain ATCC BAA-125 / DSM 18197 / FERM 7344 / JCM 9153 / C-125) TaxID=272558 RepID=LEXA_HALH5|nr:transcriptional repressor LexA [Halalkalibacterium halodurans]Q9KAD3.1 RecName: Full=LexA repressor [Halalkalibacterium halodurans C-125]MDY7222905.1 transcriptional repressor LexA [Halalkalibacterium halodurans]MDY7242126.1 transcriptional repressor LexA [Halalkalibacterium halodurans]MED4081185.1 transcriptional repressor LexA [Halalkalibacterium halodurans]MED4087020.1 transcriptional repressor LexA [Halalkalibacterium halodurans]MED4103186.1 transcriptional repressor LexA [Halalkalibac